MRRGPQPARFPILSVLFLFYGYDEDKIDDVVLALLWLTRHDGYRAWKGFDWATTDRLFKKGMIDDPVNKSKSLILVDEGLQRSEQLFQELFTPLPR
jgi:hypothetical protein